MTEKIIGRIIRSISGFYDVQTPGGVVSCRARGILRKNGETVTTRDFLRVGVPFTLAAVLMGAVYIWLVWGIT